MEKQSRLTKAQKNIVLLIARTPGAYMRPYIKPNKSKTRCFRLMDGEQRPVQNLKAGIVRRLIDKDYLERRDALVYPKVSA